MREYLKLGPYYGLVHSVLKGNIRAIIRVCFKLGPREGLFQISAL